MRVFASRAQDSITGGRNFCAINHGEPFLPKTLQAVDYFHSVLNSHLAYYHYLWFPMDDSQVEGLYKYWNDNSSNEISLFLTYIEILS